MAKPIVLASVFNKGMRQDIPRDQLPQGAVWNLQDFIPNSLLAPISKRGGWLYQSSDLGASGAVVTYANYTTGDMLVDVRSDGQVQTVTTGGVVTSRGAGYVSVANPVLYRDYVILPAPDGVNVPKTVFRDGTLADMGGTPPAGRYPAIYKDRAILANTNAQPTYVYFSNPGNPNSWDTVNSFISTSLPVTGLAALRNAILVFHAGTTERIRGNVPPPNTDMTREPAFNVGCMDARSIAFYGDNVIWADQSGVWISDGAVVENMMDSGGMQAYWLALMASRTASWTVCGGVMRGYYWLVMMNGSTLVDCMVCRIDSRNWARMTNVPAQMFARQIGGIEELFFVGPTTSRICKLSGIYYPSDTARTDANGVAITPVLETAFFYGKDYGQKRWKNLFFEFLLDQGTASPAPSVSISWSSDPSGASYTAFPSTLVPNTQSGRLQIPVRIPPSRGLSLKLQQANQSAFFRLHEIAADVHEMEKSR